jgi:hypothetical protein
MSLTNHTKLESVHTSAEVSGLELTIVDETAEAMAFETPIPAEGDWTYSATAEGRTGETPVTVNGVSVDLDGDPGFIYSGTPGGAVRVKVAGFDIAAGIIAPAAGDNAVFALMKNNDVVAFADEGYIAEISSDEADALAETPLNVDTYVGGLQEGDVIRWAVIPAEGQTNEEFDLTVAEAGQLLIV